MKRIPLSSIRSMRSMMTIFHAMAAGRRALIHESVSTNHKAWITLLSTYPEHTPPILRVTIANVAGVNGYSIHTHSHPVVICWHRPVWEKVTLLNIYWQKCDHLLNEINFEVHAFNM